MEHSTINWDTPLLNEKGQPHVENGQEITMGFICSFALARGEQGRVLPLKEALTWYRLWQGISQGVLDELSDDDKNILLRAVSLYFSPLMLGQLNDFLHPKEDA